MGKVFSLKESVTVPFGSFDKCLMTQDFTPIKPDAVEHKLYAPGVGNVHDTGFTLDMPANGSGVGLTEAPRGALGHWVKVASGKISNYQIITPTCWNASPLDAN